MSLKGIPHILLHGLICVSKMFDDEEKAFHIVARHTKLIGRTWFVGKQKVHEFVEQQQELHQRRCSAGHPHRVSILSSFLCEDYVPTGNGGGKRGRKPSLGHYDRMKDPGYENKGAYNPK